MRPVYIEALLGNREKTVGTTVTTLDEAIGCIKAFMSMDEFRSLVVDRGISNLHWRLAHRNRQEAYEERRARDGREEDDEEEEINSEEVLRRVQGYRRPREEEDEFDDEENVPDITAEGGMFGDAVTGHDDDDDEEDEEEGGDAEDDEEEDESEAKGPPPPPPIARPPPKKKPAKRMSEPIPVAASVAADAQKKTEEAPKHVPQTFAEVDQQVIETIPELLAILFSP